MKQWILSIVTGLAISVAFPGGYHGFSFAGGFAFAASDSEAQAESGPTAGVEIISLKSGTLSQHIACYGEVIAAPGALKTISLPFESRMLGVMVGEGQKVTKGDPLIDIVPSPDTRLQLDQAINDDQLAREEYEQIERRFKQKLATNEQLLQAKQTRDEAGLRLASLKDRGIDGERSISAEVGGLVKKIYVQEGSIVPAGDPMIDIVAQNRVEILLGVEPEDIDQVHPGQAVSLTRVSVPTSPPVIGEVRKISYAVNPDTRLVDVFITLPSPSGFLLGESVEGKIVTATKEGLIVPRAAVLPDGSRHFLYTVEKGHAVRHDVTIGIETAESYQVIGSHLKTGDEVIVSGNYELTDGMAVTVEDGK